MESYIELTCIPLGFGVNTCIDKFHPQHFHQLRPDRYLPYRKFKKQVIEIFKRPDITVRN